ncbi:MAG: FAD-dependent monooxygenase [Saprospiraceae bacterium]|nr:FAD-dependent monooxygenase [Saprospiraceae bacterium]
MKAVRTTDVLIIGGGPAGMLSGIYLDRLGIPSVVIERQLELSQHPKAHELSARSIEILCQLGFTLEDLKAEASPYADASRILFGHTINDIIGEIDLQDGGNDKKYETHLAAPEPYLNLSQTELEKIMRRRLQACSHATLLIGHQWERMIEEEEAVQSEIWDKAQDRRFSIRSKFLICADGAGSRSRRALGIDMLGEEKINDFISVYFESNLRDYLTKPAKLYWIMNPAAPGTFIAHHIEKRWVYHFPIYTPYEKPEQYTEEVLKKRILIALGTKDLPLELSSVSFWRMTCQIASTFRKGRAFLVGDAAHRFPPTGGLGMNSGIGDVQNLCWKLALVLKEQATESLLDTYEAERRPVIELNSEESLRNYFKIWEVPKSMGLDPRGMKWQAMLLNNKIVRLLPEKWISVLLNKVYESLSRKILAIRDDVHLHTTVKQAIKNQTEHFDRIGLDLGYYYGEGAIALNADSQRPEQTVSIYQASIEPGARFPHFWFFDQEAKKSSHDWLHPGAFTLLCNEKGRVWWEQQAKQLPEKIRRLIRVLSIEEKMKNSAENEPPPSFYPIEEVPLVLIRPDGQIAWRPEHLDTDLLTVFNQLIPSS